MFNMINIIFYCGDFFFIFNCCVKVLTTPFTCFAYICMYYHAFPSYLALLHPFPISFNTISSDFCNNNWVCCWKWAARLNFIKTSRRKNVSIQIYHMEDPEQVPWLFKKAQSSVYSCLWLGWSRSFKQYKELSQTRLGPYLNEKTTSHYFETKFMHAATDSIFFWSFLLFIKHYYWIFFND